jgi:4-hydroxybenzoate polyprenyltransferase
MNVNDSTAALGQQRASLHEMSNLLPPLAVDLDGTLLKTDLLLESLLSLLRRSPLSLFLLPFWLLKGRAHLKREIARRGYLDVSLLPYRTDLLERLRVEHEKGRSLVLATASDEQLAQQVANHLRIFDSVLASDGSTNLTGERKRECLVSQFGEKGFDYAGNDTRDLAVWSSARKAIVVSPNPQLVQAVERVTAVEFVFEEPRPSLGEYFSALRPQQWLKNILIFVPIFAAHSFIELPLLGEAFLAFLAFCCCASAGYVFNDLFDLAADRHHPKKRLRPFASGRLTLLYGFAMVPVLTVLGCTLALLVSQLFLAIVLVYFATTFTYSLYLKKIVLLDVLVLASIYTFRIFAGAEAVGIRPSGWLLGFSMFVFTSLAFVKRYGELVVMRSVDGEHATARSYELSDAELLATKGTASGYAAVLMLALYISSGAAKALYGRHELMWLLCPLLLYWLGYIWLVAHRGKMRDDPLVFALRDRTSRILILLMLGVALLAV